MIELKNITKSFDGKTAVEDISIKVENGSVYGLVGFNGAGKTTLLKCAAGVYKPDFGQSLIDGRNTFDCAEVRQRMFYFSDEQWYPKYASLLKTAQYYAGYYPDFSFDSIKG